MSGVGAIAHVGLQTPMRYVRGSRRSTRARNMGLLREGHLSSTALEWIDGFRRHVRRQAYICLPSGWIECVC